MPGWAAGLQRWRSCQEVQDSGLGALERALSSQAKLRRCWLGSGRSSHGQGQGQGPGWTLVWWVGSREGLRASAEGAPPDPAWDSRGNCESLRVGDPWGRGHACGCGECNQVRAYVPAGECVCVGATVGTECGNGCVRVSGLPLAQTFWVMSVRLFLETKLCWRGQWFIFSGLQEQGQCSRI